MGTSAVKKGVANKGLIGFCGMYSLLKTTGMFMMFESLYFPKSLIRLLFSNRSPQTLPFQPAASSEAFQTQKAPDGLSMLTSARCIGRASV